MRRKNLSRMGSLLLLALYIFTALAPTLAAADVSLSSDLNLGALLGSGLTPTDVRSVVEAAVKNNSDSESEEFGLYLKIFKATGEDVPTGQPFEYTISYATGPAPDYINANDMRISAYTAYNNVQLTVKAPEGIVFLVEDESGQTVPKTQWTFTVANSMNATGSQQEFKIPARMTGNGTKPNDSNFDILDITISADVTCTDEENEQFTETFTYRLPDASNASAVKNVADTSPWVVEKTLADGGITEDKTEGTVTFTWNIKVGKKGNDGKILSQTTDYNKPGVLNFDNFVLTDTVPMTAKTKDGTSVDLKLIGATLLPGGSGVSDTNTLTTSRYATTSLTGNAANDNNTPAPLYSTYTVTATYEAKDFKLPFGAVLATDKLQLENAAKIEYRLKGENPDTANGSNDDAKFGLETLGGKITVNEYLSFTTEEAPVPYNVYYSKIFPGGAAFNIYTESEWDATQNKPKPNAAPKPLTVEAESATTQDIAPGTYYVVQMSHPEGTQELAQKWEMVVVEEGQTTPINFVNPVNEKGVIRIMKMGVNGTNPVPLAGVKFELRQGDEKVADITTGPDGIGVASLEPGNYALYETETIGDYALRGYIGDVVIVAGALNSEYYDAPITNYLNTCTLTINKNVAEYEGGSGVPVGTIAPNDSFTFKIERKIDSDQDYTVCNASVVIPAGESSVTVNLPAVDGKGNLYTYRVSEVAGRDGFVYDESEPTFSFNLGNNSTTHEETFTNVLLSKLIFKKEKQGIGDTSAVPMEGAKFDLYKGVPAENIRLATDLLSNKEGIVETGYLPIADATDPIQYYIVETDADGYTVGYPDNNIDAWGPIELDFAPTTNKKTPPILNKKNEGKITITKKGYGAAGTLIEGAHFSVQNSEGKYLDANGVFVGTAHSFATDTSGQVVVTVPTNGAYTVTEISVPGPWLLTGSVDGGLTEAAPLSQTVTMDEALTTAAITFVNDEQPQLSIVKTVKTASGVPVTVDGTGFTFELYAADEDGKPTTGTAISPQISLDANGTASEHVAEAGKYFLKEVKWPGNVIAPNLIYTQTQDGVVYVDATGVYFGPYQLSNNTITSAKIANTANSGSLTITKKGAKKDADDQEILLPGAVFKVTAALPVSDATAAAALEAAGFKADGTDTLSYTLENATTIAGGKVTLPNLPVYVGTEEITYTVQEITAPDGYLVSDDQPHPVSLTDISNYAESIEFVDSPKATISVQKVYTMRWDDRTGNPIEYPLVNAVLGLYMVGKDNKLVYVNQAETDRDGNVLFSGLDGMATYVVIELDSKGKLWEQTKQPIKIDKTDPVGKTLVQAQVDYNAVPFALATSDNEVHGDLKNYEDYVQFRLDKKGKDDALLPHAKFKLYKCEVDDYLSYWGDRDKLMEDGVATTTGYVYETGTALGESGTFLTERQDYGYVYWFVEIEAPVGYEKPDGTESFMSPPLVPDGEARITGEVIRYQSGTTGMTPIEMTNEHLGGGSGDGTIRYFQVEITKVLENENEEIIGQLANATFALYLVKPDGTGSKKLTTFTTGLDTHHLDYEENKGRGISESFELSQLWENNKDYIQRSEADGKVNYVAHFVLEEISWPENTTPVGYKYDLVLDTSEFAVQDIVLKTYTGDSAIRNRKAKEVSVIVQKWGYNVGTGTSVPLPGAVIGIYTNGACTQLYKSAETDAKGQATFMLKPGIEYWAKEISAPNGYERFASPVYIAPLTYSSTLGDDGKVVAEISDAEYRTLTLTKTDEEGQPVKGVALKITSDKAFRPYEGGNPDTFVQETTDDDGIITVRLPAKDDNGDVCTYTVEEVSIDGVDLSLVEQAYFRMLNANVSGKNLIQIQFGDRDKVELPLKNPGKGSLTITKTDDVSTPIPGVKFNVSFIPFAEGDLKQDAAAPAADASNWKSLTDQWITDNDGKITPTDLIPGWYRLEEVVPTGYVTPTSLYTVFKVVATNFGVAPANQPTTIVNTRKGYLTISKDFASKPGDVSLPASVEFTVKSGNTSIKVTLPENDKWEKTIPLDPGKYTVSEKVTGPWYGRYALTYSGIDDRKDTSGWLGASNASVAEVTIKPGDTYTDTEDHRVKLVFTNVYNKTGLKLKKVGDQTPNPEAVVDAKFALYYESASGSKMYWTGNGWGAELSKAYRWPTFEDGTIFMEDIVLPYDLVKGDPTGVRPYPFKVTELEAPAKYTLAQDQAVSLEPGVTNTALETTPIVDETGIVISLTKFNRAHDNSTDREVLQGAEFTLYKVKSNGTIIQELGKAITGEDGKLSFVNLPKLADDSQYALKETGTPQGYVEGSLELYRDNDVEISSTGDVYIVGQNEDVVLNAYNTPKGTIAILKYDYVDFTKPGLVATFSVSGTGGNYGTVTTEAPTDRELDDYTIRNGAYVKDGIYYSAAFIDGVVPGTYTVEETGRPENYMDTSDATDRPWSTKKTVIVGEDGTTKVVIFANLPIPSALGVALDKAGPTTMDSLQLEWREFEYTLSGFTSEPTPLGLKSAVLTDSGMTFLSTLGDVGEVISYVSKVTVGKASYGATPLNENKPSNSPINATVYGWDKDGNRGVIGTGEVSDDEPDEFTATEAKGYIRFSVEYSGTGLDGKLEPGFVAGPVTVSFMAKQAEGNTVAPVTKATNNATVTFIYDAGVDNADATATATDDANTVVQGQLLLPRMKFEKSSQVLENGQSISSPSPKPGQQVRYTLTLSNVTQGDASMVNPILVDQMPELLSFEIGDIVVDDAGGMTVKEIGRNNQSAYIKFTGSLAPGKTVRATITGTVLQTAVLVNAPRLENTAYALSTEKGIVNNQNPDGLSFANENGVLPSTSVDGSTFGEAAGAYPALSDEETNDITFISSTTINKFVKNEQGKWLGNEGYAVVNAGETIEYQIVVSNNGTKPINKLHIFDNLPEAGKRSSEWSVALSSVIVLNGSALGAQVYYRDSHATDSEAESTSGWDTEQSENARAFLVVLGGELAAGQSVTINVTGKAPSKEEADQSERTYYYMAINDAACKVESNPWMQSGNTKVTIIPELVAMGGKVWIDKNANGIWDASVDTILPADSKLTMKLNIYDNKEDIISSPSVTWNGTSYEFTGLMPGALNTTVANAYDENGDIRLRSLMGIARTFYQLQAMNIPDGYIITKAYAGNDGKVPTVDSGKTRDNDSNFKANGLSEKFYLKAGPKDDTYDLGLIRLRDLTITKKGTDGELLNGVVFDIYGPYDAVPASVADGPKVGDITTKNGVATFISDSDIDNDHYLSAYAYYVVVERSQPNDGYSSSNLTVTGDSLASLTQPVTGGDISKGNYFVIKPYVGSDVTGVVNDKVTVTNDAFGGLTITKTVVGDEGENKTLFEFTVTLKNDLFKAGQVWDWDFGDDVTFDPVVKDGEVTGTVNLGHRGSAELTGIPEGTTFTVTEADYSQAGYITTPPAAATDGVEDKIETNQYPIWAFTNTAVGGLMITKTVLGNEGENPQSFDFTITLENKAFKVVGDEFTYGNVKFKVTEVGEAQTVQPVSLANGGIAELTGITAGTTYTVSEALEDGYIKAPKEDIEGTIVINTVQEANFTNTAVGGLTIKKTVEGEGGDSNKLFDFKVTLTNTDLPIDKDFGGDATFVSTGVDGEASATFSLEDGDSVELKDIPAGTAYTVAEKDYTGDGYLTAVPTNAQGTIAIDDTKLVEFTNTRELTTIYAMKQWQGNSWNRPAQEDVNILLRQTLNGALVKDAIQPTSVDTSNPDRWFYTWADQAVTGKGGNAYVYEPYEAGVDANNMVVIDGQRYRVNVEVNDDKVTIITNSYSAPPSPVTQVVGVKIWDDDGNAHGTRPGSITVTVTGQNGNGPYSTTVSGTGDQWTWSFDNLPIDTYTVSELTVNGYKTTVNGTQITNTLEDKVTVSGVKVWDDYNVGNRPAQVTIALYADGRDTNLRTTATAAGGWTWSFANLDKYRANGSELIAYTVDEVDVPARYTSTVDGTTITNTEDRYTLTVYYWYLNVNGQTAAPTFRGNYYEGQNYNVMSPPITGWTYDIARVRGTMPDRNLRFDVIYTPEEIVDPVNPDPDPDPNDPNDPVDPDDPNDPNDPVIPVNPIDPNQPLSPVDPGVFIIEYGVPLGLGALTMNVGDCFE